MSMIRACFFVAIMFTGFVVKSQHRHIARTNVTDSLTKIHQSLSTSIGKSKIVLLGEQSHYDGSTFAARFEVIRFLHEELGFNVIAFEAGLFDLYYANKLKSRNKGIREIFNTGTFPSTAMGIWLKSAEFMRLVDYLGAHPDLQITGFDCQVTSTYALEFLIPELKSFLGASKIKVAEETLEKIEETQSELFGGDFRNFLSDEHDYKVFVDEIRQLESRIRPLISRNAADNQAGFWLQWFQSFRGCMEYSHYEGQGKKYIVQNPRDSLMSENLRYIAQSNPSKKIMALGANFHFARNMQLIDYKNVFTQRYLDERKESAGYSKDDTLSLSKLMGGSIPMGHRLKQSYGDSLFSIGFTAYEGKWGIDSDTTFLFEVTPPPNNSVEKTAKDLGVKINFITASSLPDVDMFSSALGYLPMSSKWDRMFDGFMYVEQMRPATWTRDTLATGNQKSKFKGKVVDVETGAPLAYSSVLIKGTSVGTVTNFNGYFELYVPQKFSKDTLTISFVGYDSKVIPVNQIKLTRLNYFKLKPGTAVLDEVVINAPINVEQIIEKVRKNLSLNYPQSPSSSNLFYRHKRLLNDSLTFIEEAALDFYDAEGYLREPKSKIIRGKIIQIKQLRRSTSRVTNANLGLWDIPLFWTGDPILSVNNLISDGRLKKYKMTLAGKKRFGDRDVFDIKFECSKPNTYSTGYGYPSPASYNGTIYIDTESYAVLRYEAVIQWDKKFIKDLKYLGRFNVSAPSQFSRSAEVIYAYEKVKDQFVLHYSSNTSHFNFEPTGTSDTIRQVYQNELLNAGTETESPKVLTETKLFVNTKDIPYDKTFWDNFNFIID